MTEAPQLDTDNRRPGAPSLDVNTHRRRKGRKDASSKTTTSRLPRDLNMDSSSMDSSSTDDRPRCRHHSRPAASTKVARRPKNKRKRRDDSDSNDQSTRRKMKRCRLRNNHSDVDLDYYYYLVPKGHHSSKYVYYMSESTSSSTSDSPQRRRKRHTADTSSDEQDLPQRRRKRHDTESSLSPDPKTRKKSSKRELPKSKRTQLVPKVSHPASATVAQSTTPAVTKAGAKAKSKRKHTTLVPSSSSSSSSPSHNSASSANNESSSSEEDLPNHLQPPVPVAIDDQPHSPSEDFRAYSQLILRLSKALKLSVVQPEPNDSEFHL